MKQLLGDYETIDEDFHNLKHALRVSNPSNKPCLQDIAHV